MTMTEVVRKVEVAAVQMACLDGQVSANLEKASGFVSSAAAGGAKLVVLPEFMPQGYRLTQEMWRSGEVFDGPTTRWLREMAKTYGVYVGTSFLEAHEGHFFNTFALAEPGGCIAGRVRKQFPSMWEAWFFKGDVCDHYIDTDLGRIGVGICFDNHTVAVAEAIRRAQVDIMLMPHCYATPTKPTKMVSQSDIASLNSRLATVAHMYNELFGVPVVLSNKAGTWSSPVPNTLLGQPGDMAFPGLSMVIDSDGSTLSMLGPEEGLAMGEVTLDSVRKRQLAPPRHSRYIYPGSPGREIIRLIEMQGAMSYALNKERVRLAGAISAGVTDRQGLM